MHPFDDSRVCLQSSSSAAGVSDVTPINVTSHDETVIVDDDKADKTKDDDNTHTRRKMMTRLTRLTRRIFKIIVFITRTF